MSRLLWAVKVSLIAALLCVAVEAIVAPFRLDAGLKPKAVSGNERTLGMPQTGPEQQARPDYSVIVENDMFAGPNRSAGPDSPVPGAGDSAALPSAEELGLRLTGIVAGGRATSRAIIENAETRLTNPYKIGDSVASATIESIEPDRVVLVHAGRRVTLHLHVAPPAPAPDSAGQEQKPETTDPKPVTGGQPAQPPSARLGYVEELFRKATIEPHVENGRTEGLKITGLEQTPLANLFGLRNGDIVQTVNGQNLTSKQKAFQVLKKARAQPNINLRLVRDGKAKELSFDL
jgi:type II secretion system protein C